MLDLLEVVVVGDLDDAVDLEDGVDVLDHLHLAREVALDAEPLLDDVDVHPVLLEDLDDGGGQVLAAGRDAVERGVGAQDDAQQLAALLHDDLAVVEVRHLQHLALALVFLEGLDDRLVLEHLAEALEAVVVDLLVLALLDLLDEDGVDGLLVVAVVGERLDVAFVEEHGLQDVEQPAQVPHHVRVLLVAVVLHGLDHDHVHDVRRDRARLLLLRHVLLLLRPLHRRHRHLFERRHHRVHRFVRDELQVLRHELHALDFVLHVAVGMDQSLFFLRLRVDVGLREIE